MESYFRMKKRKPNSKSRDRVAAAQHNVAGANLRVRAIRIRSSMFARLTAEREPLRRLT